MFRSTFRRFLEIADGRWRISGTYGSGYRQFDETPLDYLEPGSGKAQTGYLWTSNIPGGRVIYHWREGRDQGGIAELFGEAAGMAAAPSPHVIQCDGYSAYPAWARGKPTSP